jgi:hypothetical protein
MRRRFIRHLSVSSVPIRGFIALSRAGDQCLHYDSSERQSLIEVEQRAATVKTKLTSFSMHDGSRHFASIPEVWPFELLRHHVERLAGAVVTEYLSDDVTEVWVDFSFHGYAFTVNNQYGEYWLFVSDPACPDDILTAVVEHCELMRAV